MNPERPPRRRRRRRWLVAVGIALILVGNLAVNPWCARWRSLILMSGYDWVYERDSVPHDSGVRAEMPLAGSGLYPRMITFNADAAMSAWLDDDVRFTVEFTFADFERWRGFSSIFDPDDRLYGAYVGAYYVQGLGRELTAAEVTGVAQFDQRRLALPALGLSSRNATFDVLDSSSSDVSFDDRDWTNYRALALTNCPAHTPDRFLISYLQFGKPPVSDQQYPPCEMSAQIDVTYLPAEDLTIGLYVMTTSQDETARLREQVSLQTRVIER